MPVVEFPYAGTERLCTSCRFYRRGNVLFRLLDWLFFRKDLTSKCMLTGRAEIDSVAGYRGINIRTCHAHRVFGKCGSRGIFWRPSTKDSKVTIMNRLDEMKSGAKVKHCDGREGIIDHVSGDWVYVAYDHSEGSVEPVLMGYLEVIEPAPGNHRAA